MKQPSFEMSASTRLLIQRLRMVKVGDTLTYSDMSVVVSEKISGASGCLQTARRHLLKEENIVFDVVRGVGMTRLSDTDIVRASDKDVDGIRRKAKKSCRKLSAIRDYAAMPRDQQLAHTARMSMLVAVSHMAKDTNLAKLEQKAAGVTSRELPIAETLAAFGATG
jgi:hypothetical protein